MRWEHLTVPGFRNAVETCEGVGLIPIGVLEPHATHLPLGTDVLSAHWVAVKAAAEEPVVVFPQYAFGINHESAHLPGSVVIKRDLVFALLENICEEMSRQGLKKIILLSGHGGNRYMLPLFIQTLMETERDFCAYFANLPAFPDAEKVLDTEETGHACEAETSNMLYMFPELVKMEDLPDGDSPSLERNQALKAIGAYSPLDWYAMYPRMYVGDAHSATAEKGRFMMDRYVQSLVTLIRGIKDDTITPDMMKDFQSAAKAPPSPWEA